MKLKLEKKINKLKDLVQNLESEDADLDVSVEKFQIALTLSKEIFQDLQTKEDQITVLEAESDKVLALQS